MQTYSSKATIQHFISATTHPQDPLALVPVQPSLLRLSFMDTKRNLEKATSLLMTYIRPHFEGFNFRFSLEKSLKQRYVDVIVTITAPHNQNLTTQPWESFRNMFDHIFKKHGITIQCFGGVSARQL